MGACGVGSRQPQWRADARVCVFQVVRVARCTPPFWGIAVPILDLGAGAQWGHILAAVVGYLGVGVFPDGACEEGRACPGGVASVTQWGYVGQTYLAQLVESIFGEGVVDEVHYLLQGVKLCLVVLLWEGGQLGDVSRDRCVERLV